MAVTMERVQELAEVAQRLGELKRHDSWHELRALFERKKERWFKSLAARIAGSGIDAPAVNQRELDYQRGFWAGGQWVLDNPEMAEASLENALRRAQFVDESKEGAK